MYTMNLYSIDHNVLNFKILYRLFITFIISTLIGFSTFYLFSKHYTPKTVLIIQNTVSFIIIYLWHSLSRSLFSNNLTHANYIFIGNNYTVTEIIELSKTRMLGNFTPKAIYDENNTETTKLPCIKNFEEFKSFCKDNNINIYVLSPNYALSQEMSTFLFDKLNDKAVYYSLPDFFELIARKIPLGAINDYWILSNTSYHGKIIYKFFKRISDILIALLLTPISIILFPIIALIIKLESKGPVFFVQKRLGLNGKVFNLYKFRTMRTENNNFAYTVENDNRITKFGKIMRKMRIDELPQVINILKGDMSLIGPRPERPELAVDLQKEIPYYNQRLIVKPGITGWDQASGEYHSPSVEDTYKKLQNDLYYVKNQGFALDFSIFFKTIRTVFAREGQ